GCILNVSSPNLDSYMAVNFGNQWPQYCSDVPLRLTVAWDVCAFIRRRVFARTLLCFACLLLCLLAGSPLIAGEPDMRRDATVIATEQVVPCVVNIATETVIEYHEWYDDLLRQFYGWPNTPVRQEKSISLGSGVIVDEDGYVLTNFHVIRRANR